MAFIVFAQNPQSLGSFCGEGLGPFGKICYGINDGAKALGNITSTVSAIIGFMTVAAGIWFIFQFMIGGFYWITSGGDKTKLETARHRINDAFIGLIIVVAGWAILAIASQFLGVNWVSPGGFLPVLQFGH